MRGCHSPGSGRITAPGSIRPRPCMPREWSPRGREVDVIATNGGEPSAFAVKKATSTIPIVSVVGQDPVATGLVASFARPSGNLTGFTVLAENATPHLTSSVPHIQPRIGVVDPNLSGRPTPNAQSRMSASWIEGF